MTVSYLTIEDGRKRNVDGGFALEGLAINALIEDK
jgi:hypothetical protein